MGKQQCQHDSRGSWDKVTQTPGSCGVPVSIKGFPSSLASCLFETGRETEEKKLKSPSLNTPPSLREIIINNSSLVLWKMLNDRNGTSHGRQKGILMEYKNNNALLLLMATINSLCCVRYGPSCLRHRNYFL